MDYRAEMDLSAGSHALAAAERVIQRTDREHPADAVLRLEARSRRSVSREEAGQISRSVFTYYRWRGWLDLSQPLHRQIRHALDLADQFAANPSSFPDGELVARCVPDWIQNEMNVTPGLARSFQSPPQLWLRARPGCGPSLAMKLGDCRTFGEGALADSLVYDGSQDLFQSQQFHAGEFELQDISSQAVGLVCAPAPGETWWDACAGEGGKMLHLSDLMRNQGLIWASDRAEWRLRRLKRRTARARVFNYRKAIWDGGSKLPTKTKFDGILVDAPCSGTGTWQRNPHARWTLRPEDLKELSELQLRLLTHAGSALKPRGKLVYSVCSLARSETVGVVDAFGRAGSDLCPLMFSNPLASGGGESSQLWLHPQEFGGNGMFIACWSRR